MSQVGAAAEKKKPEKKKLPTPARAPRPKVLGFHGATPVRAAGKKKAAPIPVEEEGKDEAGPSKKKGKTRKLYKQAAAEEIGELGSVTPGFTPVVKVKKSVARRPVETSKASKASKATKNKIVGTVVSSSEDEEVEDSSEDEDDFDEDLEEEAKPSPKKKPKVAPVKKPAAKPKTVAKKPPVTSRPGPSPEARIIVPAATPGSGERKSGRARTAPVDFWNHERVVYDEEGVLVDVAVDHSPQEPSPKPKLKPKPKQTSENKVVTNPAKAVKMPKQKPRKEPTPKAKKPRKDLRDVRKDEDGMENIDDFWDASPSPMKQAKTKSAKKSPKRKRSTMEEEEEDEDLDALFADDGYVEEEDPMPVVRDRVTGLDKQVQIVKLPEMLEFIDMPGSSSNGESAKMATAFGSSAWSSSVLVVPPRGQTAVDISENKLKSCVILMGQVTVSVHRSHFVMKAGGMFYIPPGNIFSLENPSHTRQARISMSEFKLFDNED